MNEAEAQILALVQRGMYSIDAEGRIWKISKARRGTNFQQLDPIEPKRAEGEVANGYLVVNSTQRPNVYTAFAHRIVWLYFFEDIPDEMQVNHKNGDKKDNRPTNLELVTDSENKQHARQTGLIPPITSAKLTEQDVVGILADYATGNYSQRSLARKYSVKPQTINNIVHHKSWTHVQR